MSRVFVHRRHMHRFNILGFKEAVCGIISPLAVVDLKLHIHQNGREEGRKGGREEEEIQMH